MNIILIQHYYVIFPLNGLFKLQHVLHFRLGAQRIMYCFYNDVFSVLSSNCEISHYLVTPENLSERF